MEGLVSIGIVGRVFANGLRDWGSIPVWVIPNTQKMVLDASLLNTQNCKIQIMGKWWNPGKRVAPSSTPQCSSYFKGRLWVALDYVWTYYLLNYYIYIYICIYIICFFCNQNFKVKYCFSTMFMKFILWIVGLLVDWLVGWLVGFMVCQPLLDYLISKINNYGP